jgi:carboxymethylenebutenolidase
VEQEEKPGRSSRLPSFQDWAREKLANSPRHYEWVTVKHDGRSVDTFIVYPESKDKRPVVLIIHEIFGMTDWVQDLADQVAEAGYIAVAPDLLSGMGPNGGRSSSFESGKANEAVSKLNPDQVTADLNAAADYGKTTHSCLCASESAMPHAASPASRQSIAS